MATLITGASAGIGAEFARLLAAEGETLVITARREDRLEALAEELRRAHGVRVEPITADLAHQETADLLAEKTRALGLEVGTLINNAGFGLTGAFADQPTDRVIEMLEWRSPVSPEFSCPRCARAARAASSTSPRSRLFCPGPI